MSIPVNITETALIKMGQGKLKRVIINSHSSGTLKLVDGFTNGVVATTTLTSSGAMVPADYAIGTLTSDATNVSDGDTVVCGATGGTSTTYRFKTTLVLPYDVLIGADAATSLANLKKAINATGTNGTEYLSGTLVNPDIIAYTLTATTLVVGFRTLGTGGNAYTTTETSSHLGWGGTTLAGGVTAAGASFTLDTNTYTAVLTLGDTLGLSVANQVLWVTSEAVFLDNVKSAINRTGTPGTDYSAATTIHPTVFATTNTNTTQVFNAKYTGTAGNSIVTTEGIANYAFTSTVMASGTLTTGKILCNTITFSAVATTGERFIDFDVDFSTGLLAVVGGTADLTFLVDLN